MKLLAKRALSATLAAALTATTFLSSSMLVFAGDQYPYVGEAAAGENQPYQHGYRVEDIMNWSPETDPYAELLRAQIPLQNRNDAFAATQADPNLTAEAQYLTLTGDYGNSFFNSGSYTNEFSTHVFNFWQYVDQYASWHGMPSVGTPPELNDIEDERNATDGNAWKRRYFEFGLVNLPNPAYTNAAHKNGVLSLGCMFQPRAYQNFEVMLYKDEDGRYPVADKLSELAKYYGFDGYFFNMEGRSYSADVREQLKAFFAQMRENGMYIQWYNAGSFNTNMLTSATAGNTENATLYANSVFIEYGNGVPGDGGTAPYGLNKYEVAFNGYEAGRDRWSNNFSRMMSNGIMNGSIASLGTDFVQTGLEKKAAVDPETGYNLFTRELDEYQWMAFERERLWWTGNNARTSGLNAGLTGSTSDIEARNFTGVANYIAERTVVNGDTFYTNFNTGHGLEYVVNGEVSSNAEWSNIIIQDILPTWQWWFETDGTKLSAEFDYGSKYTKVYNGGTEGSFGFDLIGAYNGGSSLAVYGALDAENFMHLYKTNLDVKAASKMAITFKKTSDDAASMKLGVIFEDDTDTIVKLDIANSAAKSDEWVTSTVDFSDYAGKKIAAFGLVFDGEAADYQMNIGQMKYTSNDAIVPEAPTGLTIDKAYETGEMVVSWDMASYDDVKQYNVYAVKDGKEIFLGGTYDEVFYIKNIGEAIAEADDFTVNSVTVSPKDVNANAGDTIDFDAAVNGSGTKAGDVTIVLKAVSADGTESEGTTAAHNYNDGVKNITVDNSVDGKLTVAWAGGEADVTVTTSYEKEARTWTASGENGCTIEVPTGAEANGAYVTVTITTKDGVSTMVDTTLPDKYCAPYDGRIWSDNKFTQPSTSEWHELHYQLVTDGVRGAEESYTRGVASHGELNNDWAVFKAIPNNIDGVYVWLVDYAGNKSEERYVNGAMSVAVNADANSVQAGATLQLTATVRNYLEDDSVTWSISGNTSANTTIDENGLLTVAEEESASSITVRATSVEDTVISGTKNITVLPAYAIYPNSGSVYKGETTQFAVQYKGENLPASDYTWSVAARYSWNTLKADTKIDENGLLTVASDESTTLVVTAVSKENPAVSYTTGNFTVQTALTMSSSGSKVTVGKTMQFTATYKGAAADSSVVSWSVEGANNEATTISENGLLQVSENETASTLTVRVTAKSNANVTASKSITVDIPINIEGCVSIGADILGASGSQGGNEGTDKAVDGEDSTKWCHDKTENGWLAIDLGSEFTIDQWIVKSCGTNGEPAAWNTSKFALEVLKDPNATAAQLADSTYLANKDNWTEVEFVDNSAAQSTIVNHKLAETVTGRYFRLRIDKAFTTCPYPAIRIHEFQLYGEAAAEAAAFAAPISLALTETLAENSQEVTWTVEGAASADTKIDENGTLMIGLDETAETLYVTATSTADETKSDTAVVHVTAKETEEADKTALEALINYANTAKDGESYQYVVPAVKAAFEKALADAEAVYADAEATQDEVNAAYNELLDKVWMLEFTGNKENLQDLYDFANELNLDLFTSKTAEPVREAIEAAKAVLDNENALQAEIDEAYEALKAAVDALKMKVDKTMLENLIKQAQAIDLSKYLDASKTDFGPALENAIAVFADEDATAQEIKDAYDRLQKAIFDLRLIPDKSVLEGLLNNANAIDQSLYTEETVVLLNNAIDAAMAVMNDDQATEAEVKAAEATLTSALDGLELVDADTDEPTTPDEDKDEDKTEDADKDSDKTESPNTGDYAPIMIPVMLALAGSALLVLRKKSEEKN